MTPGLPPLVDPLALAHNLGHPDLRIYDATVRLIRPPEGGPYTVESGRDSYEREHIPGAAFADIPNALSDPASPFHFTVPSPEHFAEQAGKLGIAQGKQIVVYAQESPMWATRLWWLLRFFSFDAVSVLDGGLPAWRAAGLPVEAGLVTFETASLRVVPRHALLASRADVEAIVAAGGERACLVNALTPSVFRGEGISSYTRAGRIPGSINAPWNQLVSPETNRFLSIDALRRELSATGVLDGLPIIAYCGGGISATVDLFALSLVGMDDAKLYDGSMTEWTHDPALPVETG
jgi:thiosulfate/3-mercaptopyruvate sulfurtransferase